MINRRPRSWLEAPTLDSTTLTAGQRYSVVLLAGFTVVLFAFGMPDGKIDTASGVGEIPTLAVDARISPAPPDVATSVNLANVQPIDLGGAPIGTAGPAYEPPPSTFDTAPEEQSPPSSPPPTTTTTEPPAPASPLPIPLPVPLPIPASPSN